MPNNFSKYCLTIPRHIRLLFDNRAPIGSWSRWDTLGDVRDVLDGAF